MQRRMSVSWVGVFGVFFVVGFGGFFKWLSLLKLKCSFPYLKDNKKGKLSYSVDMLQHCFPDFPIRYTELFFNFWKTV